MASHKTYDESANKTNKNDPWFTNHWNNPMILVNNHGNPWLLRGNSVPSLTVGMAQVVGYGATNRGLWLCRRHGATVLLKGQCHKVLRENWMGWDWLLARNDGGQ